MGGKVVETAVVSRLSQTHDWRWWNIGTSRQREHESFATKIVKRVRLWWAESSVFQRRGSCEVAAWEVSSSYESPPQRCLKKGRPYLSPMRWVAIRITLPCSQWRGFQSSTWIPSCWFNWAVLHVAGCPAGLFWNPSLQWLVPKTQLHLSWKVSLLPLPSPYTRSSGCPSGCGA
jgi:hypothetical protein